ncbi:homogentisate solanesyltransferase, chloroplastic [Morus notabilis]|uniref:homogentisate solanesyltransferase, chloroplastic n=1 Tax=Morus notabilis TaxID=981085 RepID=UPI000CED1227|nr:homogentisate solanesyltransferase, chloroplastic [Morus notabilis]
MELVIPHSSSGVQAIRTQSFNPTTKNIKSSSTSPSKYSANKLILPVRLYGKSRFSRFLIYGQHKRNSIRGCAQIESVGSNPTRRKAHQDESTGPDHHHPVLTKVSRFGSACFNFLRPVAMCQITISTTSLFARVVVENPHLFKWSLVLKSFPGLIAVMLANAYNIGINQIYDVDIDRFKESPIATLIVIPLQGGVIQNVGILYATRSSLGLPLCCSPSIVFITTFVTLFCTVISFMKDITDVEGDLKHNIRTFPVIFGPRNVTFFGTGMLLLNYVGTIAAAIYMPQAFKRHVVLPVHLILALSLLFQVGKLENANYTKEASEAFYVSLWKLLILEFLLFPFM